jgi:hypothetical protein
MAVPQFHIAATAQPGMNGLHRAVHAALTGFVDQLYESLDRDGGHVGGVLGGDEEVKRTDLNSEPEEWTEDSLIYPLLDAVGLHKQPGRPNPRFETPDWVTTEIPDFELIEEDDTEIQIIGENKSVNKITEAEADIQEYISKLWWPHYGIATDGIEWAVHRVEESGTGNDDDEATATKRYRSFSKHVDLRPALQAVAAEQGYIGGSSTESERESEVEEAIQEFVDVFAPDALIQLLEQTAPKELRDERKRDVDVFYELYIELLFGQSDEYDDAYNTCLREDIIEPPGATRKDCDVFAVTLVNRLLFIKFLEKRGVMDEGFLADRAEAYNDGLPETLYETVFTPLFYDLLNTPLSERPDHQTQGWKGDVPYLNGGLFRANVDSERQYDVENHTLPMIIHDLIEGHQLDFELDPAILGSVFEKTINHISEEEDRQKETGAYYTPDDVTTIINDRAVRPKARAEIIDAYAGAVTQEQEFRDDTRDISLDEMLTKIEDGASWFGRSDGMKEALNRIQNLTVLDPACGSGHFLTVALDELHRIQLSLLRGTLGSNLDAQTRYSAKKKLALNTIYGVDVEPVGVEIAKLRIWLKIIEEEWTREFGRLPNIDVNIATGNSLIGFPIKGELTGSLDLPNVQERVQELVQRRLQYRHSDEGDKGKIERLLDEEIRPELDDAFIDHLNYTVETRIEDIEEFDAVMGAISDSHLYPVVDNVRVRRPDGNSFDDAEQERFNELGFRLQRSSPKSGRLHIDERESELRANGGSDLKTQITAELREVLEDGYEFTEFHRQPLSIDYDDILGRPFHWPIEFPEIMLDQETELDDEEIDIDMKNVTFDLVLGNPPYGDIMGESEEVLTAPYRMASADVAALFVERQAQLIAETGYFGNITTLKITYKANMDTLHDLLRTSLSDIRKACFGTRPSRVFDDADIRTAILTGRGDSIDEGSIQTSEYILFSDEDREQRFQNIEYRAIERLVLKKDGIDGNGGHIAIPKVGTEPIESILTTLREHASSTIQERTADAETDFVIWRREGARYFTNPMLKKKYDAREVKPFYFESELEARAAFLAISSSIFYVYWCAYGDMFHLNLWEIRAFPFLELDVLEPHREEILEISDRLWALMEEGFDNTSNQFRNYPMQKPVIEEADALLGEIYGLSDKAVAFVQDYHSEYGRHGPENETLPIDAPQ